MQELSFALALRAPLAKESSVLREHLDSIVIGVGDVDVARRADRYPPGAIELTIACALRSPHAHEHAIAGKDLDSVVPGVGDVRVRRIDRDRHRQLELAGGIARRAPHRQEGAVAVEHLDPGVAGVGDVDLAGRGNGDSPRLLEAACLGSAADAGDEHRLD